MADRTIWVAGDWQHADFAPAMAWLEGRARLLALPDPLPKGKGTQPHAILIAQSRPGQISPRAVEQWRPRAPQARLVSLVGPWCEGEQRSGNPWPGVLRVAWRTWPTRLPLALGFDAPDVRLPRTATDAERLQSELATLRTRRRGGVALVRTKSRVTFDGWRAALEACGLSAAWAGDVAAGPADLEVIDGWDEWLGAASGAPRILVLHFPREGDLERAAQLGAAGLLSQPLLLADLAQCLSRLRTRRRSLPALPPAA
jgi:hypothetical protein